MYNKTKTALNIIRVNKDRNFTVINNSMFKDEELPLRERGLLSTIMTLPDTWDFSINGLCSIIPNGKKAVYSSIKILIEMGYCKKTQTRREDGSFGDIIYDFYEIRNLEQTEPITLKGQTIRGDAVKAPQSSTHCNKELKEYTIVELEDSKNISPSNTNEITPTERGRRFIAWFNKKMAINGVDRNFKFNDSILSSLNARISEGYTHKEIEYALDRIKETDVHVQSNFKWITPEFILRKSKLEVYVNAPINPNGGTKPSRPMSRDEIAFARNIPYV